MPNWPPKDPNARLDYVYTIPLDPGDNVTSYTFTKLSGTVVLESHSLAASPATNPDGVYGRDVTAWLSGGADGDLSVFYVTWQTAAGRVDDDLIALDVVNDAGELVLTGYAKPAASHLTMRYPAFAAVVPATIRYWLEDAERGVDTSWSEGDYAAGLMALAAHNMAIAGLGTDEAGLSGIPKGTTRLKSGSFEAAFTNEAANARATGSFSATRYGQEYMLLLRRNRGGPRITPTGVKPAVTYPPYPAGGW